ncbi:MULTISPECIES: DUF6503 family protein [unclassified Lentimonas]|uniref:DUF6503 family protein n=1 Tax=unclassified Lentimonas TaxID=2630993 RepID=UPI001389E3BE|nr:MULTISPECIES: DUF6503 family protein [unclassified Lentimonas]
MRFKIVHHLVLTLGIGLTSFVGSAQAASAIEPKVEALVDATQESHGLRAWWGKEVVVADVAIAFGGKTIVDGTFTFEAHGPRARYDRKDGVSILFDGNTAWVSPADSAASKGRFHVLTWPWFMMAPFKMKGDGIHLSDLQSVQVDGQKYETVFQTFGENMGDTPDDWYRFYIDPKTKLVDAMSYIVTYGKDLEKATPTPSIIEYFDYMNVDGVQMSTRYELWHWDAAAHAVVGDAPKGTGVVSNIHFTTLSKVDFSVPPGARELPLN